MAGTTPSAADSFWSLFQATDHVRIDGLRINQVHALLRSFSTTGFEPWFAWYESADDWAPLSQMVELINKSGSEQGLPPIATKPSANDKTITYILNDQTQTNTPNTVPSPSAAITRSVSHDGRVIPRFKLVMSAVVDYRGKLVRSETVDVSLGGMRIKDPLPFPSQAIVIVTLTHQNIELVMRCRLVDSANAGPKHRLLIETCHRMDLLRKWIVGLPPA